MESSQLGRGRGPHAKGRGYERSSSTAAGKAHPRLPHCPRPITTCVGPGAPAAGQTLATPSGRTGTRRRAPARQTRGGAGAGGLRVIPVRVPSPAHTRQETGVGRGGSDPNRGNTSPQSRATSRPAKGRVTFLLLDPPRARSCTPRFGKSPQITPHPDSQWIGGRSPRRGPAPAAGSGGRCGVARRTILSLSLTNCPPPAAAVNPHCEAAGDEGGARLGRPRVYPPGGA